MAEVLRMTIPGKPDYIKAVKLAVGSVASIGGFDYESIEDIRIAVGEACKCITCHNHMFWSSDYEVRASIEDDTLTVVIEDDVAEHAMPKEGHMCLDCPRDGELSMQIIRSIMDDLELKKDGEGYVNITMQKKKGANAIS